MNASELRITRRQFLRGTSFGLAGLISGAGALGGYGRLVEPYRLDVSPVQVVLPGLPIAFDGLTIALLTDLHIGTAPSVEYLQMVVDRTMEESPDLIALGGDYISTRSADEPGIFVSLVSKLRAPLGVYAILGNRDYEDEKGWGPLMSAIAKSGVPLLDNSSVPIRRNGQVLYLTGLPCVMEGLDDLPFALRSVPPDGSVVLLVHEPDFADEAALDPRVVLQLSGHSHGGQVCLPFVPRILPKMGRKYPQGLRRVGNMQVYTSRGIGEVDIPIRINCPPELPIIRLSSG